MSDDNTVKLSDHKTKPVPEVVETLEALLEKAKAGELRGLAYASVFKGGDIMTSHVGWFDSVCKLIGHISYLNHTIMDRYFHDRD